jgi:hypothetical protein
MADERSGFHDGGVLALRARFADDTCPASPLPRWTLPFAWCFAIGIWLVVLFVIFAPGLKADTSAQGVAGLPPQRIVQARLEPKPQESLATSMQVPSSASSLGRPRTCSEAQARGQARAREGEAGYAPWLDGDHDGISCERWGNRPYPP